VTFTAFWLNYHQNRDTLDNYVERQQERNKLLHEKIHAAFPQAGLAKSIQQRSAEKQK
jgi:hypothetical protein